MHVSYYYFHIVQVFIIYKNTYEIIENKVYKIHYTPFPEFSLFFIILKCVCVSGGDEAEAKIKKPTCGDAPTIPNGTARDRAALVEGTDKP